MAYKVEWYEKPHIASIRLFGTMTRSDMQNFADELIALAAEVPDVNIHSIVDVTDLKDLPPINVIAEELIHLLKGYTNRDMSTIIGTSKWTRYLVEILVNITPARLRVFDTQAEAESFVREMIAAKHAGTSGEPGAA